MHELLEVIGSSLGPEREDREGWRRLGDGEPTCGEELHVGSSLGTMGEVQRGLGKLEDVLGVLLAQRIDSGCDQSHRVAVAAKWPESGKKQGSVSSCEPKAELVEEKYSWDSGTQDDAFNEEGASLERRNDKGSVVAGNGASTLLVVSLGENEREGGE